MADYSNWKILVIDDGEDDVELVLQTLRYYKIEVFTAATGSEALELLVSLRPTLIITDLRMPHMDGWSVLTKIRSNPDIAHIPVVAMTAYSSARVKRDMLAAGFNAFIIKPIRTTDVLITLEEVLA